MKFGKKIVLYSITLGTWVLSQFGIGNSQYVNANETGTVNPDDNIYLNPAVKVQPNTKIASQVDELFNGEVQNIQSYGHRSHRSHRSHRFHYSGSGGYGGGGSHSGGGSGGSGSGSSSSVPAQKKDIIAIRDIQKQLNLLGYDCGAETGQKNAATIAAIKNFQIEYGLNADGYVDWQTEAWLNATKIEYVRNALKEKGYKLDEGTGRSQAVIDAIKDFQKKNGLDVNGRIDLKTKQTLGC